MIKLKAQKQVDLILALLFFVSICLAVGCAVPRKTPANAKAHVVFLISKDPNNYEADKTIPAFAEWLSREYGYKVSVLLGQGERTSFRFPGLEILPKADLLIVFSRRLALQTAQMNLIKDHLKKGKPLVGIRTANHAFTLAAGETAGSGYESWEGFVADVLGCKNRGYGPVELGTDVKVARGQEDHPILKGIQPTEWHSKGNVYYVAPLLDEKASVLLTGTAGNRTEPIAWTRMAGNSRVFYTSLGYPADFSDLQFKQLLANGIRWTLTK